MKINIPYTLNINKNFNQLCSQCCLSDLSEEDVVQRILTQPSSEVSNQGMNRWHSGNNELEILKLGNYYK